MKEAIPMNSPDESRYSEPHDGRDYKDAERIKLRQTDPKGESKRHETKTPEGCTHCVDTGCEATPLRSIETMLLLSFHLMTFYQTGAGREDGGECQKQTS
jgi:hypothetical protein